MKKNNEYHELNIAKLDDGLIWRTWEHGELKTFSSYVRKTKKIK